MKYSKPLFFIAALFFVGQLSAQPALSDADEMPTFAGCEATSGLEKTGCSNQKLVEFIGKNIRYPETALKARTEGVVVVEFVVDKGGAVTNPSIVREIGNGCGEEALRVLKAMPNWAPGMKEGQPVAVNMKLPVRFNIPTGDKGKEQYTADNYRIFWGDLRMADVSVKELNSAATTSQIMVRDLYGKEYTVDELTLSYDRGTKVKVLKSPREISPKMLKTLSKAKEGGAIIIETLIQKDTRFISVKRTFNIVKS